MSFVCLYVYSIICVSLDRLGEIVPKARKKTKLFLRNNKKNRYFILIAILIAIPLRSTQISPKNFIIYIYITKARTISFQLIFCTTLSFRLVRQSFLLCLHFCINLSHESLVTLRQQLTILHHLNVVGIVLVEKNTANEIMTLYLFFTYSSKSSGRDKPA